MKCRRFSPEVEAVADVWSTSVLTTDTWTPTGKEWNTNSAPILVANQNNLQGVAKPGKPRPDSILRAANEKIVSDLAYVLTLPVPPVILWDRGEGFAGERYCAISAWAFQHALEWPHVQPRLSGTQLQIAAHISGAMKAFDTWVAASDRKNDHVLVSDDGDPNSLGLAYIDYAFSLTYEWSGNAGAPAEPRGHWPNVGPDGSAIVETVKLIESLEDKRITEVVERLPITFLPEAARATVSANLITRRQQLRGWLGIAGG